MMFKTDIVCVPRHVIVELSGPTTVLSGNEKTTHPVEFVDPAQSASLRKSTLTDTLCRGLPTESATLIQTGWNPDTQKSLEKEYWLPEPSTHKKPACPLPTPNFTVTEYRASYLELFNVWTGMTVTVPLGAVNRTELSVSRSTPKASVRLMRIMTLA
jgi:hypothetical protein